MVLQKSHAPNDTFDTKYKPSFSICKWISDKAFDIQESTGKVICVSIQHLQLLHPTEHVSMHLPDITSFGWIKKYINHSNLMPNLHNPMKYKVNKPKENIPENNEKHIGYMGNNIKQDNKIKVKEC